MDTQNNSKDQNTNMYKNKDQNAIFTHSKIFKPLNTKT